MLKISVRNSRFTVSVNLNRLLKIKSSWLKFGPWRKLRGTLPRVLGSGVAKASGFKISRSAFKNGSTPGTRFGRRTFREAPPPGVLITPTNPGGRGAAALIVPGSWVVNPFAKVVVPPALVGTTQPAALR